jgi:hypothetical protein
VVDDEYVDRALNWFQLEPELFLQRGENRCGQIGCARVGACLFLVPLQVQVEAAAEIRVIANGSLDPRSG